MASTYLVTGTAGFIGASLATKLSSTNKVVGVVRPDNDLWRLESAKNNLILEHTDLEKPRSVNRLIDKYSPDYIIHLATHGVYSRQKNNIKRILLGNYEMTYNLLSSARRSKNLKKFINSGSVFEYGSKPGKMSEDNVDITDVLNHYSASKYATSALAASFYDTLPLLTLRYFTAYGPYEDSSRFIRLSIERAIRGEELVVVPGVVRDFVYIKDLVDGIMAACASKAISKVVNIASGEKSTLEETAKLIVQMTKAESKVTLNSKYKRAKDSACWADISKAKELFGWSPKYPLAKGLKETVEWARSYGK